MKHEEKMEKIKQRTNEMYKKQQNVLLKQLEEHLGKDCGAYLIMTLCMKLTNDILSAKGKEAKVVKDQIIGEMGSLAMKTQMEAIREIDPGQFLKNCMLIGSAARDLMEKK